MKARFRRLYLVFEKKPKALEKSDFHKLASKNEIGNPDYDFCV